MTRPIALPRVELPRVEIGVLALQGGVEEHLDALRRLDAAELGAGFGGIQARPVKRAADLDGLDGIILPGGESSAVGRLLSGDGPAGELGRALRDRLAGDLAAWGTCMGAILLAKNLSNDARRHLGLLDVEVERNAYGGQLDSFVEDADVPALEDLPAPFGSRDPFPLVFIRAPAILRAGAGVEVLARSGGRIAACRSGRLLATTFHPELTDDLRFHALFAASARRGAA